MNKVFSFIVMAFFTVFTAIETKAGIWETVQSPVSTTIFSASFADANTGVISTFYQMYKTTNAGNNWYSVFSGDRIPQRIMFAPGNSNVGYAACYYNNGGRVLKTTNMGETWTELSYNFAQAPSDIYVVSSQDIYISSYAGNVYHSQDGGENWGITTIPINIFLNNIRPANGTMFAVTFNECYKQTAVNGPWQSQGLHGISASCFEVEFSFLYVGGTITSTDKAVITQSSDQGVSWTPHELVEEGSVQSLFSFEIEGYAAGYLYDNVSGQYYSCIWKRIGGANWSLDVTYAMPNSNDRGFKKLAVAGLTTLFAVGTDGAIMKYNFDSPLPIELSSFNASVSGSTVVLNWTTTTETNNSSFNIERKAVDQEGGVWQTVSTIVGHGTTTVPQSYSYTDRGLSSGIYTYRLKQIDYNGNYEYFNLTSEVVIGIPNKIYLSQNYPNPFNPVTTISYTLPTETVVSLSVFDITGREVKQLISNQAVSAGYHSITFDATTLSSGIYFYKLTAGNSTQIKKMTVMK